MFLMRSRTIRVFAIACCIAFALVSVASAAPGDIDRSFGQEGLARVATQPDAYPTPDDMAVGPDKKIYVLEAVRRCPGSGCSVTYTVSRFLAKGLIDRSFGSGGTTEVMSAGVDTPPFSELGALAVDTAGRVVLAGTAHGKLLLARLNADGSADSSFGRAGVAEIDLGVPVDQVQVAVQADGRIAIGAEPLSGYGGDAVVVARYLPQGSPDPSFNSGAPLITSLGSGLGGFALSGANRLLLAGPRCCSTVGRSVHLARLDESGHLDGEFGRQGQVFVDDVANGIGVGALLVRPNGQIYVAGLGRRDGDAYLMRLLPSGKLDRKFGHRGIAYMRGTRLRVAGAAVDRAGRILIAGTSSGHLGVLRRLPNGHPDLTFAGGGLDQLRLSGSTRVVAADLQGGRSLVALGAVGSCIRTCPPPKTFLVRYLGGDSASRCLGKRATIVGTRHGERLVGTRRSDVIVGLGGNDVVLGRGGNDLICGGPGSDRLIGGKGRDQLSGGAGHNELKR
jgi:uncharacterized delta-60 repeat protein